MGLKEITIGDMEALLNNTRYHLIAENPNIDDDFFQKQGWFPWNQCTLLTVGRQLPREVTLVKSYFVEVDRRVAPLLFVKTIFRDEECFDGRNITVSMPIRRVRGPDHVVQRVRESKSRGVLIFSTEVRDEKNILQGAWIMIRGRRR